MRNRRLFFGGAFVLLGLFLALVPPAVAPVCEAKGLHMQLANGRQVPMKCFWASRAELGLAILLVLDGLLLAGFSKSGGGRIAATMAVGIGVVVILVPTILIGTCMNPSMPCNVGTKPTLILLGVLTVIAGGIGAFMHESKA